MFTCSGLEEKNKKKYILKEYKKLDIPRDNLSKEMILIFCIFNKIQNIERN